MKIENTIFTCTTFFDFENQDKWNSFCVAIDSILEHHKKNVLNKISKWIIVNEYSEFSKKDWIAVVKEKYPFIEVIQKTKKDSGQAQSLNIILDKIKKYTYWIHWEESWYCKKPCLSRMFDVMCNTNITQLQCTHEKIKPSWLDLDSIPRKLNKTINGIKFYEIYPSAGTYECINKKISEFDIYFVKNWPLYSLRPSINRVGCYKFGDFSTNPKYWPFRFEWDFAKRWLLAGNTKAVLPDGPIMRDEKKHISTWMK
jgi:hypothetical protein